MIGKLKLYVVILLISSFGVIGVVDSVGATPTGSQKLRGLGGRVFFVEVQDLSQDPAGEDAFFDNCYFFEADGTWIDPPFPAPGVWNQNSNGAKTSYLAGAVAEDIDLGIPGLPPVTLVLNQEGTVTPAGGKGVLQLWAFTEVSIPDFGIGVVGTFISIGHEVDECPL